MTKTHLYHALMKRSRRRGSMTGFALWDVLLLVALIASILLAIFLIQQSRTELRTVEQRNAKLLWADQLVAGFASSNLRLPCPDINNDGIEDWKSLHPLLGIHFNVRIVEDFMGP